MINFAEEPSGAGQPVLGLVSKAILEAKNKWISDTAKKHMPDFVLTWVYSKNANEVAKAKKWLDNNQYHMQEHPDGRCRFLRGNKILSEFKTVVSDGKVSFETKNYE